jgi:hypothetical protein
VPMSTVRPTASLDEIRSLLKYWQRPRGSNLGWMARRERRAYPQRSVRSKQRRQTAQSASALRVAPLLVLTGVAPQSQTAEEEEGNSGGRWMGEQAGMLLRRSLVKTKIDQQRGPFYYFNRLLGDAFEEGRISISRTDHVSRRFLRQLLMQKRAINSRAIADGSGII